MAYKGQEYDLSLVIVWGNGSVLFSQDWLPKVLLDLQTNAFHTVGSRDLEVLLPQYEEVYREELGTISTPSVHLSLKKNSQLKFNPARLVPFVINDTMV